MVRRIRFPPFSPVSAVSPEAFANYRDRARMVSTYFPGGATGMRGVPSHPMDGEDLDEHYDLKDKVAPFTRVNEAGDDRLPLHTVHHKVQGLSSAKVRFEHRRLTACSAAP